MSAEAARRQGRRERSLLLACQFIATNHAITPERDSGGFHSFVFAGTRRLAIFGRYKEFGPDNFGGPALVDRIPTPIAAERFHQHEATTASLIYGRIDRLRKMRVGVAYRDQCPRGIRQQPQPNRIIGLDSLRGGYGVGH